LGHGNLDAATGFDAQSTSDLTHHSNHLNVYTNQFTRICSTDEAGEVNAWVDMYAAEAGDPNAEPLFMYHGWPQHWWM
jgi:phytoene dehydrogenase-like protein